MRSSETVDIIVPVYNQLALAAVAVQSAIRHGGPRVGSIVIVDDASPEPGIREWARSIPGARYIRQPKRLGFAAACNAGARLSTSPLFVLLNSDTEATPGWLSPMVERMEADPKIAVVGPLLLYHPQSSHPGVPVGKVQSCGHVFTCEGMPYHRLQAWSWDNPRVQTYRDDLQSITGAVWLVKRAGWQKLNGLFEPYGSYFEDTDYCIRCRVIGWKVAYEPRSLLYHHVGASGGVPTAMMQRNAAIFLERCKGVLRYDEWALS